MAAQISNNSSQVDICSDRNNRVVILQPYLNTFIAIRVAVSLFAIVANLKLLILQRKAKMWFGVDRPLILGILIANVIGSLAVIMNGTSRLITSFLTDKPNLKLYLTWMTVISDAAIICLVLYIAALSIRSYLGLRYFYSHNKKFILRKGTMTVLAALIMTISFTLSFFGLNTHSQGINTQRQLASDIGFFLICMTVQLGTALILYKTKQFVCKLQNDFAVNRAQQQLESRVSLYHAIEATRAFVPLSTVNVVIWFTLWTLDFIFDRVIAIQDDAACGTPPEYYIWSSIMDISAAAYSIIYPYILTRKKTEAFLIKIRKTVCCVYEVTGEGAVTMSANDITFIENGRRNDEVDGSRGHWDAMNSQWDCVERSKKVTVPSQRSANVSSNKVVPTKEIP